MGGGRGSSAEDLGLPTDRIVRRSCSIPGRTINARARPLKGRIRGAACVHSHRGGILKSISDNQKNQPTFGQPTTRLPCPRCCSSLAITAAGHTPAIVSNFGTLFAAVPKHTAVCISFLPNGYVLCPSAGRPPTANTTRAHDLFRISRPASSSTAAQPC